MQDSPWENRQCTGKGIIMAAADIGIDLGTSSILVYTKGKGIGLFLSREIIEKHGGTIMVTSGKKKKGSTFVIQLPYVG